LQRVLTTVVLLGLLLATAAAFAITEHLKLIKSDLYEPKVSKTFSPVCHCPAEISFKLRRPDSVTVTIVDSNRNVVDTLPTRNVPKNALVTFRWNGDTSAGVATDGSVYQPRVALANDRHTILMPNKITADTVAPRVVSASAGGGLLITRGSHGVTIHYDLSEKAHAAVYLGDRLLVRGRPSRPNGSVKWNGKAAGKTLPPGRYVLKVGAVDLAGNETPPAERKRIVVRIRDIALSESSIHVAPRARFSVTVRTGAPHYAWRFAGAHGTEEKKSLRLRAPKRAGRYRLVVREHGHATTAIVTVGKRK
jgi:hypothetical protein